MIAILVAFAVGSAAGLAFLGYAEVKMPRTAMLMNRAIMWFGRLFERTPA